LKFGNALPLFGKAIRQLPDLVPKRGPVRALQNFFEMKSAAERARQLAR